MVKKTVVTQNDFCLGEVSEDFLEKERQNDEDGIRSTKKLRNMQILNSGAVTTRPGTIDLGPANGACEIHEVLKDGEVEQAVVPTDGGLFIMGEDGSVIKQIDNLPWNADQACDLWVKSTGNEVLIGSSTVRPQVLDLEDCTVTPFEFADGAFGSTSQPYYSFNPGVTIQPSNTTGSVTVTASQDVFTPDYVGTIIRYAGQEILVTAYTSATEITGTFLQDGPPTYNVTVSDGTQYSENDAVEGNTSSSSGIVTAVSGNVLTILLDESTYTFTVGEALSGPSTVLPPDTPTISAATAVAPAATVNWDEQVFSDWRGWPGHAECHTGRLVFTDIPNLPGAIMLSASGDNTNFEVGTNDGDAIFEVIDDARLLYSVSLEDLLIFGVDGVRYLGTRNGDPITPTNFYPRKFTSIGASRVEPTVMGDGVAYLSSCGTRLMGAVLAGDVNRYWQDAHIGEYAPHLIRNPIKLGSTEGESDRPEKYLFAVNEDGTVAVMRWSRAPFEQKIGWGLWETKGNFVDMSSAFCSNYAIVDRAEGRRIEKFSSEVFLDGVKFYDSLSDVPEPKADLSVYANCRYLGEYDCDQIDAMCYPDDWGPFQVGCAFNQEASLWPRNIASGRAGFVKQRNGRVSISVLNSTSFLYNGKRRPSFIAGEDLSSPPKKRTDCYVFSQLGRQHHPCHEISKPEPGPLTVLAVNVEVQV